MLQDICLVEGIKSLKVRGKHSQVFHTGFRHKKRLISQVFLWCIPPCSLSGNKFKYQPYQASELSLNFKSFFFVKMFLQDACLPKFNFLILGSTKLSVLIIKIKCIFEKIPCFKHTCYTKCRSRLAPSGKNILQKTDAQIKFIILNLSFGAAIKVSGSLRLIVTNTILK